MAGNRFNTLNKVGFYLYNKVPSISRGFRNIKSCKKYAELLKENFPEDKFIQKTSLLNLAGGIRYACVGTDENKVTSDLFFEGEMEQEEFDSIINEGRGKTGGIEAMLSVLNRKKWDDIEKEELLKNGYVSTRVERGVNAKRRRLGLTKKKLNWAPMREYAISLLDIYGENTPDLNLKVAEILDLEFYLGKGVVTREKVYEFYNRENLIPKTNNQNWQAKISVGNYGEISILEFVDIMIGFDVYRNRNGGLNRKLILKKLEKFGINSNPANLSRAYAQYSKVKKEEKLKNVRPFEEILAEINLEHKQRAIYF